MAGKSSIGGPPEDTSMGDELCNFVFILFAAVAITVPVTWLLVELGVVDIPAGPPSPAVEAPR